MASKRELLLLQLLLQLLVAAASSSEQLMALPGCRRKCGNIAVPYPFGIGPGCFRGGFDITCDGGSPRALIPDLDLEIEITDISLAPAEVRAKIPMSYQCYNETAMVSKVTPKVDLTTRPAYIFSSTRNKFTALGCFTLAHLAAYIEEDDYQYGGACVSYCWNEESIANGSCSNMGCCQVSIPKQLGSIDIYFRNYGYSDTWNISPCSYAFLVAQDSYNFSRSDLSYDFAVKHRNHTPVVLDWAIRNQSCQDARVDPTTYACRSNNSICSDASNGPGYLCSCLPGYDGNPYLHDGCQDIDECKLPEQYPCHGICVNRPGNYSCACPQGTQGNATTESCRPLRGKDKFPLLAILAGGISVSTFFIVLICYILAKRKLVTTKQKFFDQNGGYLLQQQISSKGVAFKIYTVEELKRATNNFNTDRVLGQGGFGTVYKGIFEDKTVVAIKKPKKMEVDQIEEFAKEMFILSQINHKNVVKLLGCCLEVKVPMLVYEFVSNGTLSDHLHGRNQNSSLNLDMRLTIAVESAEALAYLHSWASPPILHCDVKSANILLDENFTAKVSDFGASKLVPNGPTQYVSVIQGTLGYLDPEFQADGRLTNKSDVYSFGVVLLELLTGKRAIYSEGSEEKRSLVASFYRAMNEDRLLQILDDQVKDEGGIELLEQIADLAGRCLDRRGEDRPTMKEVAEELEKLRKFKQHSWEQNDHEETDSSLDGSRPTAILPHTY
ncbi:wall-associated receptor kinase 3-like [Phoenix dactylifera]|uniref:Wall-associated receptor kinase 3-like n=1 Tax=Phoenix dactylifera TaxID=42345 RepID=A0A8B8ZS78_PHODC|nr:wall-associated receptor kinase 3-like [Phoenix dactylifera]